MEREFYIYSDASKSALGAVLCQLDEAEFPRPVAFASKKLKEAETKYSTSEREIFAIVWSVNYFKHYLLGREFTIFTDHRSLTNLVNLKDPTNRLNRWSISLANFRYKIKYIAGKCNKVADFLSRGVSEVEPQSCPVLMGLPMGPSGEYQVLPNSFVEEVKEHQRNDRKCNRIRDKLAKGERVQPYYLSFFEREGTLVCTERKRKGRKDPLLVIPATLIQRVLYEGHDAPASGHLGILRTLLKLKAKYYWPGMSADVHAHVKSCQSCNRFKAHQNKHPPPLLPLPICQGIGDRVHVDFVGPLNVTAKGNRYVLTFTDAFSRYVEAFPTPSMTAEVVTEALIQYISRHGIMKVLVSDRGANFLTIAVARMCSLLQIRRINTTSYRPQGNGMAEKSHSTLMKIVAHLINRNNMDNWDQCLSVGILAYNTAVCESTGYSPAYLTFGRDLSTSQLTTDLEPRTYKDIPDWVTQKIKSLNSAFKDARRTMQTAAVKMVQRREKRAQRDEFQIDELVFLYDPAKDRNTCKQFRAKNRGPFRVLSKTGPLNYRIKDLQSGQELITHVEKMTRFIPRESSLRGKDGNPAGLGSVDEGNRGQRTDQELEPPSPFAITTLDRGRRMEGYRRLLKLRAKK